MNQELPSYLLSLVRTKYPTKNKHLKQLVRQYKLEKQDGKT